MVFEEKKERVTSLSHNYNNAFLTTLNNYEISIVKSAIIKFNSSNDINNISK